MRKLFFVLITGLVTLISIQSCKQTEQISPLGSPTKELPSSAVDFKAAESSAMSILNTMKSSKSIFEKEMTRTLNGASVSENPEVLKVIEDIHNHTLSMLNSFGFTEKELDDLKKEISKEDIAVAGIFFSDFYAKRNSVEGTRSGEIQDCLLHALGADLVYSLMEELGDVSWEGFKRVLKSPAGKKIVKKTFLKVASRSLGVVGTAIAVFDFVDCMW